MKTINDLKDEISLQFSSIISALSIQDVNTVMAFILMNFSNDFPKIGNVIYKLDTLTGLKIYLENLSDDFLEAKLVIPIKQLSILSSIFYKNIYESTDLYLTVDEAYCIQLTNQYVNSMSSYYVPKKPMIFTDSTGEYINLNRDSIILYSKNRVVDPNNIKDHIYSVLKPYSFYKFIEFMINAQYGRYMDINEKIFNLIYDKINSDMTNDSLEQIKEVSLGGLSVTFDNNLSDYSDSLKSLANNFNNSAFVDQMNRYKDEYLKKFKRKKNIFYNYIF